MNVMPISEIIEKVTMICKKNNVKRLDLFGSFATGTATPTSDIDFVVYGCDNLMQLEDDLLQIETLRKIDIFNSNMGTVFLALLLSASVHSTSGVVLLLTLVHSFI